MHEPAHSSVSSIQPVLRRIRALAQRRVREAEGCYWVEGVRNFVQACDSKQSIDTIVWSKRLLLNDCAEMLGRRLAAAGVKRVRATPEEFRAVSEAERASGIGAIVRQRWTPLERVEVGAGSCVLVIEEVRSPGNLGTILRTAEACGVGAAIFVGPRCDPFDPAVVRASMGGLFHVPLVRTGPAELRAWVKSRGVRLVGLAPRAERVWTEMPRGVPVGLLLGEERQGLSAELRGLCDCEVRLPMVGRADSLNVSIAAGVVMYEWVRGRGGGA